MESARRLVCPDGTYAHVDVEAMPQPPTAYVDQQIAVLEPKAKSHDPVAQALLGMWFYEKNDFETARKWLERSIVTGSATVEKDVPHALSFLAQIYDLGQSVAVDRERAFKFYLISASAGVREAQFNMGYMYHRRCSRLRRQRCNSLARERFIRIVGDFQ